MELAVETGAGAADVVERHRAGAAQSGRVGDADERAVDRPSGQRAADDLVLAGGEQQRQGRRALAQVDAGDLPRLEPLAGAVEGQLCTSGWCCQITIRSRELHEALASARAEQTSAQWKARYAARAGVEGTMRQATHVTGIRRARYLGLPKTQLEHNIAAAAINMIRMDAYWTGHPLDRTRSSHLARLDFTLTA